MQPALTTRYSLVIPVYRNAENIDALLAGCLSLHQALERRLEVVLVVDGSPDDSHAQLQEKLPGSGLRAGSAVVLVIEDHLFLKADQPEWTGPINAFAAD